MPHLKRFVRKETLVLRRKIRTKFTVDASIEILGNNCYSEFIVPIIINNQSKRNLF